MSIHRRSKTTSEEIRFSWKLQIAFAFQKDNLNRSNYSYFDDCALFLQERSCSWRLPILEFQRSSNVPRVGYFDQKLLNKLITIDSIETFNLLSCRTKPGNRKGISFWTRWTIWCTLCFKVSKHLDWHVFNEFTLEINFWANIIGNDRIEWIACSNVFSIVNTFTSSKYTIYITKRFKSNRSSIFVYLT